MSRPPPFSFFLCLLILAQPATQTLAQDAKPDDPPPLKAAGLRFQHEGVQSATFSPDGRLLVTQASGKSGTSIIVWDATTGKTMGEPISVPSIGIPPLEITADGKFLVQLPRIPILPAFNKEVIELRRWELPGLKPVGEPLPIKRGGLGAVGPGGLLLTADGETIGGTGEVCVRELATGKLVGKPWKAGRVNAVAFSPDGKHVIMGYFGMFRRYDVSSGTPVGTVWGRFAKDGATGGSLHHVVVSADGKSAATFVSVKGVEYEIQRWNVDTDKTLGPKVLAPGGTRYYPLEPLPMVAIHKDARTVAVTTKDKFTVQVLDLETGKAISADLKHTEPVSRLIFSPDGKLLLTAGGADGPWLWDVTTGRSIARVPQKAGPRVIAFRPDGKALVTGSEKGDGGTLTLWELPAQK